MADSKLTERKLSENAFIVAIDDEDCDCAKQKCVHVTAADLSDEEEEVPAVKTK